MFKYIDDDIVNMRLENGGEDQFYWGDKVEILEDRGTTLKIAVHGARGVIARGTVKAETQFRDTGLLRLSMVDVQQGDGLILETPDGKVMFIDGGDNQLFARHANARFPGTSDADPLIVDLMLITHGDADHFEGLTELRKSETDSRPAKRIFVAPRRVYHNGLVKRPGKAPDGHDRADKDMFGATTKVGTETFITALVDDPASLPATERNSKFETWVQTLAAWEPRTQRATGAPIERRRLDHLSTGAFDFLADENIAVELLGPIVDDVAGGPALRFLRSPPDDAELMLGTIAPGSRGSLSASHTINGHSINFRLRYGNVRFFFTGDMNQEASQRLREAMPAAALSSEILKAPHHGSADFDMEFLKEIGAVVSLISSGDESEAKEYIHPRATLMAALGKAARTTPAVIFCTELAAFFKTLGYVQDPKTPARRIFAFERTNFGIAHVRTDGERVLTFTHSGKRFMNEAYRFTVSATGEITFAKAVTKRSAPKAG
ncbi:competence protein [Sphingomonas sp. AP4-R1]|uniref:ComEC/Rec2 family competence protein n=1 Tax=Sphingomonas sp. AP4-R1 TaxID=2735134 RepID=UPI00149365EA|nr:competence protein [Sphingomonas sp. AP4-R1]QJU57580.1 competence protein [Sphingomonas sp. AP4-R1]